MSSPWFQFTSDEERSVRNMTLPALIESRYVITKTTENDFVLRDGTERNEPTDLAIVVGKNLNVTLSVEPQSASSAKVNGQDIAKGKSTPLQAGEKVQLDDCSYVFNHLDSEIGNLREQLKDTILCPICRRIRQDSRLLKCGHIICGPCLDEKIRAAVAVHNDDMLLPTGVAAVVEHEDILQQMRTIVCNVCQQKFSVWDATRTIRPAALSQALPEIRRLINGEDDACPKCAVCNDTRCVVDVEYYEFCETCKMILCPVCTVQNHRDHKLRSRPAIVKAMHDYGKVLSQKKIQMNRLRKKEEQIVAKANITKADFRYHTHRVQIEADKAIHDCKQIMDQFDLVQALFDDSGKESFDRFSARVQESTTQLKKLNAVADAAAKALDELRTLLGK